MLFPSTSRVIWFVEMLLIELSMFPKTLNWCLLFPSSLIRASDELTAHWSVVRVNCSNPLPLKSLSDPVSVSIRATFSNGPCAIIGSDFNEILFTDIFSFLGITEKPLRSLNGSDKDMIEDFSSTIFN